MNRDLSVSGKRVKIRIVDTFIDEETFRLCE